MKVLTVADIVAFFDDVPDTAGKHCVEISSVSNTHPALPSSPPRD